MMKELGDFLSPHMEKAVLQEPCASQWQIRIKYDANVFDRVLHIWNKVFVKYCDDRGWVKTSLIVAESATLMFSFSKKES